MERTEDEWARIAGYVRHTLNKLAPQPLPLCLPGEPQECGKTAREHVLLWSAELKAVAHDLIETSAPTREDAVHYSGPLYRQTLESLRGNRVARV
ncbi:hypothetical protein TPA0906_34950 [Streptomyces olivaceus]|uniref:hypothetical protein n=1 Tax=Streptomyces TaxID=1883 RepID=UPI0022ED5CA9|nr:hypothetical protein [Streptomyces olivaceus]GHJ01630.1 hypothetical protein TPA0906_34950 [Streptomyces olivaceus]